MWVQLKCSSHPIAHCWVIDFRFHCVYPRGVIHTGLCEMKNCHSRLRMVLQGKEPQVEITTSIIEFLKWNLLNGLFNKRACSVFSVQTWTPLVHSNKFLTVPFIFKLGKHFHRCSWGRPVVKKQNTAGWKF